MSGALVVRGLAVGRPERDAHPLVSELDLTVQPGECLGLVGESGSGKSLTLRAIAALLPKPLVVRAGSVAVGDAVLPLTAGTAARKARRARIAMVFQDPSSALDPLKRVGAQVAAVRQHVRGRSRAEARRDAVQLLAEARLPHPEQLYGRYPHELSGGQRQRVMIAFALASDPEFLLCDEPTTALDVTVQAEILALLDEIRVTKGVGVLFVTHDLPVIARVSSRIAVMRHGAVVETGDTLEVLGAPAHEYTRGLVASALALSGGGAADAGGAS
ncbi:ABC transporter ATP-binding protein [Herbiconiux moechotypicola]|uniref:ABC transporter domain-containing protein n=1 Tax=Herbiconiux moechotypicola TaxID=637393 RepID=A0ABP5Q2U1_9MICO|nr:ABC transporter ATP-binding protein [Herbiconiux moechotypicola]MCS5728168.1 ABC transporter ATP-binding protein [Herbiconiux moechotypicola]